MKKLTLALATATALISGPVLAADLRMPVKAPVYAPAPYNWTGFYIGIQGGGGFGDLDWTYLSVPGGIPIGAADHRTRGGLVGGTVGFNWQAGSWVFGIEADYAWADISGSTPCPNPDFSCQSRLDSFGTARGRVGMAMNQVLLYATGGAAFGDQNIRTVQLLGVGVPPTGTPVNGSSNFAVGWTAGGGLEWGFMGNWSAKVEALYFDLGTDNYTVDFPALQTVDARHTGVVVRGGVNFRF
jgi:outer membrane immunogenic protein